MSQPHPLNTDKILLKSPFELNVQYNKLRANAMVSIPKTEHQKNYAHWRRILCADLQSLGIGAAGFVVSDISFIWGSGSAKCRWKGPAQSCQVRTKSCIKCCYKLMLPLVRCKEDSDIGRPGQ